MPDAELRELFDAVRSFPRPVAHGGLMASHPMQPPHDPHSWNISAAEARTAHSATPTASPPSPGLSSPRSSPGRSRGTSKEMPARREPRGSGSHCRHCPLATSRRRCRPARPPAARLSSDPKSPDGVDTDRDGSDTACAGADGRCRRGVQETAGRKAWRYSSGSQSERVRRPAKGCGPRRFVTVRPRARHAPNALRLCA